MSILARKWSNFCCSAILSLSVESLRVRSNEYKAKSEEYKAKSEKYKADRERCRKELEQFHGRSRLRSISSSAFSTGFFRGGVSVAGVSRSDTTVNGRPGRSLCGGDVVNWVR